MGKISATILTFNEERRIEACLQSLEGIADEVIVIDSFSTDATVEICRRHGCRVTQRHLSGYGAQRQYATSLTTHSYVLSLDADEVLSPALRQSILNLKRDGFRHRGYCFPRLNLYCGKPVKYCGWYPDTQVRLFDKRYANWNLHDIDERVIFHDNVKPSMIDGDILHFRCDTPEEFLSTETNHARLLAKSIMRRHPKIGAAKPYVEAVKHLLKCYIAEGGILEGRPGRAISLQRYRSALLSYKTAREIMKLSANENHTSDKR